MSTRYNTFLSDMSNDAQRSCHRQYARRRWFHRVWAWGLCTWWRFPSNSCSNERKFGCVIIWRSGSDLWRGTSIVSCTVSSPHLLRFDFLYSSLDALSNLFISEDIVQLSIPGTPPNELDWAVDEVLGDGPVIYEEPEDFLPEDLTQSSLQVLDLEGPRRRALLVRQPV